MELINFCEKSNRVLYETWCSSMAKTHDSEVLIGPDEHQQIFHLLVARLRSQNPDDSNPTIPEPSLSKNCYL